MHDAVIRQRVHLPGLRLAALQLSQRLRNGDLVHDDLIVPERGFRDPVTGLDDARLDRSFRCRHTRGLGEEGGCLRRLWCRPLLVDHLQCIVGSEAVT